jgi:hypothetical protein
MHFDESASFDLLKDKIMFPGNDSLPEPGVAGDKSKSAVCPSVLLRPVGRRTCIVYFQC